MRGFLLGVLSAAAIGCTQIVALPDQATKGFCASLKAPVTLCDDFDGESTVDWSDPGAYALAHTSARVRSQPAALHFAVDSPGASMGFNPVRRMLNLGGPPNTVHVEYDAFLVSGKFEGQGITFGDSTTGAGTDCRVDVFLADSANNGGSYAEGHIYNASTFEWDDTKKTSNRGGVKGAWTHIEMEVDFSVHHFSIAWNGGSPTSTVLPDDCVSSTKVAFTLGTSTTADGFEAYFDNLIVDIK